MPSRCAACCWEPGSWLAMTSRTPSSRGSMPNGASASSFSSCIRITACLNRYPKRRLTLGPGPLSVDMLRAYRYTDHQQY